jgi:hypothetical protein
MRYTIEEYEHLALEAIEDARQLPVGLARDAIAIAQVYATLALAVPVEDDDDDPDGY